jgi:hypothetical protein
VRIANWRKLSVGEEVTCSSGEEDDDAVVLPLELEEDGRGRVEVNCVEEWEDEDRRERKWERNV